MVIDFEECRIAYFKPAYTVEGLISDMHLSLATEPKRYECPDSAAHFVDRRYKGQSARTPNRKGLHCIVCKKKRCWSTNHSKKERLDALHKHRKVRQLLTSTTDHEE